MRITKLKKINYTRSIVVSVTATVMLAAALVAFSPERTTGNAASLKHIEEIVAQSGTFNILEIVPDEKAASFGYYIAGQEPISSAYFDTYSDGEARLNGWMATLAKTSSPAGRSAFANELFGRLASRGILGN
ncbi:MAG: hypothetical protein GX847_00525, partial [Clostridiales bacterium]|nr:hypothetical protein [Clostridiales bacterium]